MGAGLGVSQPAYQLADEKASGPFAPMPQQQLAGPGYGFGVFFGLVGQCGIGGV
jgi:hypothetical protein